MKSINNEVCFYHRYKIQVKINKNYSNLRWPITSSTEFKIDPIITENITIHIDEQLKDYIDEVRI